MSIIEERWRPVVGDEKRFVSSHGRAMGPRGLLKVSTKYGYAKAGDLRIHVAVAEAFFGPRTDPKHVVCHGDHGHLCNGIWNLRYDSHVENMGDKSATWAEQGKKPSPVVWPLANEYRLGTSGRLEPVAAEEILSSTCHFGVVGVVGSNPAAPIDQTSVDDQNPSENAASGPLLWSSPDQCGPLQCGLYRSEMSPLSNPIEPGALKRLNARLKEDGVRVQVVLKGPSAYLRASYPHKDGGPLKKQYSLKLDTIELHEIDKLARKVGALLRYNKFDWSLWGTTKEEREGKTVADFREAARKLYDEKYDKETTWKKKWGPALAKLPPDSVLVSSELLAAVVRTMTYGSAGRRDQGHIFCQVAQTLKLPTEEIREAARGYTTKKLQPRDIPTDDQIESIYNQLKPNHWRWMFGMCAAFGLRPHEIVECKLLKDGTVEIGDETKTGFRLAWACKEEWLEKFNLFDVQSPPQTKETVAKAANDYLHKRGPVPFALYNLRHAYAIRLFHKKVPSDIGARLMGHSDKVHRETYHRWYDAREISQLRGQFQL